MNKVKFYRFNKNLSQRQLAQMLEVTPDYVSQIERGRRPGIEVALKLAQIFNTSVEDLFVKTEIKLNKN